MYYFFLSRDIIIRLKYFIGLRFCSKISIRS